MHSAKKKLPFKVENIKKYTTKEQMLISEQGGVMTNQLQLNKFGDQHRSSPIKPIIEKLQEESLRASKENLFQTTNPSPLNSERL